MELAHKVGGEPTILMGCLDSRGLHRLALILIHDALRAEGEREATRLFGLNFSIFIQKGGGADPAVDPAPPSFITG